MALHLINRIEVFKFSSKVKSLKDTPPPHIIAGLCPGLLSFFQFLVLPGPLPLIREGFLTGGWVDKGLIVAVSSAENSHRIARRSAVQSMVQALLNRSIKMSVYGWIKTSESAATKGIAVDFVEELELHVFHNF